MVDNRRELLVIVSGLNKAGAELMLYRMIKNLDRSNLNVNVISLTSMGQVGTMMVSDGITVHALNLNNYFLFLLRFARLIKLIRKIKPDVIQTWMYHADLIGGLASKISGYENVVWSIRNSSLSLDTTKYATYIVAKICSTLSSYIPKVIICCSFKTRESHISFGYDSKKMVVIQNGYELGKFLPINDAREIILSELALSSDTQIVGLIGRYHKIKNHLGFINAASLISNINPKVRFLLVGEGIDNSNKELLQYISSANLSDKFHLLGPRSDIPVIMSSLDVLVSTSFDEAFSNVIAEAMACGTLCVSTDVGDTAFIINDTGKLVAVGDFALLANSVLEILNLHPEKRKFLSKKARDRIIENFDISVISSKYLNIYNKYF